MPQPASFSQKITDRLHLLVLAYLFFIVYGSLIPFELRDYSFPEAISAFKNIRYLQLGIASRGDWVANILLYIPLAFMMMASFDRGRRIQLGKIIGALVVIGFCLILATLIEFVQIFFAPRTVSLNDLLAEVIGSVLGVAVWMILGRSLSGWSAGGRKAFRNVFYGYFVILFLFSFFPFDVLVSFDELMQKLRSDQVALFFIDYGNKLSLRISASRAGFCIVFIPFGALLSSVWNFQNRGLKRAIAAGALMALFIEGIQIFVASAVTEGGSIILGAIGTGVGYWGAQWLRANRVQPVIDLMYRFWFWLALAYLLFLMLFNGWFSHSWQRPLDGFEYKALIPFYYHYFSTEASAVRSLLFNFAMYAPLGVGLLLSGLGSQSRLQVMRSFAPVVGALLALVLETGKLFLSAKHPDYTNVLVAMVSTWVFFLIGMWLLNQLSGSKQETLADDRYLSDSEPVLSVANKPINTRLIRVILGGAILVPLFLVMGMYPVGRIWLFLGIIVYIGCLFKYPHCWLLVLPVLMPLLDFASHTGWFFITEFDFFVLATVVGTLLSRSSSKLEFTKGTRVLITLYSLSVLISLIVGIWPLPEFESSTFSSYLSNYNALRVVKGFVLMLLLLPALQSVYSDQGQVKRYLITGMLLGFLATVGLIIWERALFPGVLNFSQAYRATGLFSSLHTGGGMIDGYLAVTIPFLMGAGYLLPKRWALPVGLILLALACYALLVTYSRIALLTITFIGFVALVIYARQVRSAMAFCKVAIPVFIVIAFVAIPIYQSPFFKSRIDATERDMQTRLNHWADTIDNKPKGFIYNFFGAGLGSFPREYYAANLIPKPLPIHDFRSEGENSYLHIAAGGAYYIVQRIRPEAELYYDVSIALRPETGKERLAVSLCEQVLLYSDRCVSRMVRPNKVGEWATYTHQIQYLNHQNWAQFLRPVFFSLYVHGGKGLSIDDISIHVSDGEELMANGNFSSTYERWFFISDDHLRWHIENLPLQVWFEQGWAGLLLFFFMVAIVLIRLATMAARNDLLAAIYAVSIVSFLIVGLTSSLFDFPKLTFLFYLVFFAGWLHTRVPVVANNNEDA